MKSLCKKCGNLREIHAKELCRLCYDKKRLTKTLKLSPKVKEQVDEVKKDLGWEYHRVLTHLICMGLKHREHIKELGGKI